MKSFLKKLVLLLLSGLFGFLLLELGVRAFLARKPYELPLFEARPDGVSYRLRPNQHFDTQIESRPARIETDAWGNAGDLKIVPERRPGWRRIAVLGDSFAFGLWAEDPRHSMVGVAAEQTAAADIEWVNFAVPGYGYPDMRRRLEQEVVRWQPDWVLLCTFNGNDFRETFLGPEQMVVVNGIALPNEAWQRKQIPAPYLPAQRRRPLGSLMRPLRRWSQAINMASHLLSQMGQPATAVPSAAQLPPAELPLSSNFMSFAFWSMTNAPVLQTQAVERALGELQAIADLCSGHGIRLAIAAIPTSEQVYVKAMQGPGYDLQYPQRHIEQFCAQRQIPYLDLLPAFRQAAWESPSSFYCHTDPHFNNEGHALAGRWLADFCEQTLCPPGDGSR
jgi:lysophospholipase L1-like esterase